MHYIWFLAARTVIISTFLHLHIFVFMHEELTLLVWHWHPKVRLCVRFPLICLSSGNLSLHMPIIWIHLSLWMYILHCLLCKHPSTSLLSLCGKSSRCYKDWWRRSLCWIIWAPWCPWSWKSSQLLPIMSPGRKGMFIWPLHWWRLLPDRLNNGSWTGGAWMFSCCCNSCAQVTCPLFNLFRLRHKSTRWPRHFVLDTNRPEIIPALHCHRLRNVANNFVPVGQHMYLLVT